MNSDQAYRIQEKFHTYFEGYSLIGSSSLWIPFYKKEIEIEFTYLTKLNILEEFLGRCIEREVTTEETICDVLNISKEILDTITAPLVLDGYLIRSESNTCVSIEFTPKGQDLFASKTKYAPQKTKVEIFYDGINERDKIERLFGEAEGFFHRKEALKDEDTIYITGRKFPTLSNSVEDEKSMSKYLLQSIRQGLNGELEVEKVKTIRNFKMRNERELYFKEYGMVIFKNSHNELSTLIVDLNTEKIEPKFQESVIKLLNENYFSDYFDLSQEVEGETTKLSEVEQKLLKNLKDMSNDAPDNELKDTLQSAVLAMRPIRNYEIRSLFLKFLDEAKESLFIISPWMNNYIINTQFKQKITALLKRGVKVHIVTGITSGDPKKMGERDQKTNQIVESLIELGEKYNGLLKIHGNAQTHEKVLICDGRYYITGSFNFLSYSGEENNYFRNESGVYIEDKNFVSSAMKILNFI